ncbi:hypothetical protein DC31_02985 [Microbacterium sp. CH12i]|nr:hypothetical protein DC31_02985 [Microbacterium sp. CH12i]
MALKRRTSRSPEPEQRTADQLAVRRDRIAGSEPGVGEEPPPVHRDGRKNARGTVRGSSNDSSTGGVLFIDGKRKGPEPLPRHFSRTVRFDLFELLADCEGAALHFEDAGEHTIGVQTSIHAVGHRIPDRVEPGSDVLFRAQSRLVHARDVGNRDAMFVAEFEQGGRICVAVREGSGRNSRFFALASDESAADRIVGLLRERCPAGVVCRERHGIRMPRQPGARRELDVFLRERNLVTASRSNVPPTGNSPHAVRTSAGSHDSGASPRSPATTASGVPCPIPVAPSEP